MVTTTDHRITHRAYVAEVWRAFPHLTLRQVTRLVRAEQRGAMAMHLPARRQTETSGEE